MREIPERAVDLVKEFEGFRAEPYTCSGGVVTIGIGTTVYPDGRAVSLDDDACAECDASEWLRHDLKGAAEAVERLVAVNITDGQYGALVSFTYNLGQGNFAASTLLKKLNAGNYEGAADEFPKWRKAGGSVMPGLVRRRAAEIVLFWS